MTDYYFSIEKAVEDIIFKVKGSKFIGYACPIQSENEVKILIEHLWELHPNATHICYAYRLGAKGEIYKTNDNGEPSGTAGLPIYNQILSKEISDVFVASIRYYGGTKLGAGGLVKAYKYSAQITLDGANIIEKILETILDVYFPFSLQGIVNKNMDKYQAKIISQDFQQNGHYQIKIRNNSVTDFIESLKPHFGIEVKEN